LVQAEFRRCFKRWGRPTFVRVDNGNPWGSCGDLPTPLALWLIGLGIGMIWNPPRRPQDNGVVERSQGVASNWAEPDRCHDVATLQRRLNEEDRVQRESYPYRAFRSRLEAYPSLRHSGRLYNMRWERAHWSWTAVLDQLAAATMSRRVDCSGKIGLYHGKIYVGTVIRGRDVVLQFDADAATWVITDQRGVELCRRELTQFNADTLCNLPTK
jgi:hypothetical protein